DGGVSYSEVCLLVPGLSVELFALADWDDDELVTPADVEAIAANLPEAVELALELADTNEDGAISLEEAQAHIPILTQDLFAMVDMNGDGVLDVNDLSALDVVPPDPPDPPSPTVGVLQELIRMGLLLDANGDCIITYEEAEAELPGLSRKLFSLFNVTGDLLVTCGDIEMLATSEDLTFLLEAIIDLADTDGDNAVSLEEGQVLVPSLQRFYMDMVDLNGDGVLDMTDIAYYEPWGPSEGEGEGYCSVEEIPDFYQIMVDLERLVPLLPDIVRFHPSVADLNGPFNWDWLEPTGNGILDEREFALIAAILEDPTLDLSANGGVSYQMVCEAWNHNRGQFWSTTMTGQLAMVVPALMPGAPELLVAYMTLGDIDTVSLIVELLTMANAEPDVTAILGPIVVPNPCNYILLAPYLSWCGDADGDGCLNIDEYLHFGPENYVAAALDPDLHPGACIELAPCPDYPCEGEGEGEGEGELALVAVIPDVGSIDGGEHVAIEGSGFVAEGATEVLFGGEPATNVIVTTGFGVVSFVSCITPPHPPGVVDVTVVNPDGGAATLAGAYAYVVPGQCTVEEIPDFYAAIDGLENAPFISILTELPSLPIQAAIADLNGAFDLYSHDVLPFLGNGMLDAPELSIITGVLDRPGLDAGASGVNHTMVCEAWNHNWRTLHETVLQGFWGQFVDALAPTVPTLITGYVTLGDFDTVQTLLDACAWAHDQMIVLDVAPPLECPNPCDYILLAPHLSWCGDADGDGCANIDEYLHFGPQDYVTAALDPDLHPGTCAELAPCPSYPCEPGPTPDVPPIPLPLVARLLEDPHVVYLRGTVEWQDIEGGFWGIVGENGNHYDPLNLPPEFAEEGLPIAFVARLMPDMGGFHMWGTYVDLLIVDAHWDGLFTMHEAEALIPPMTPDLFHLLDANQNGLIDFHDCMMAIPNAYEIAQHILDLADMDGDRALTLEEAQGFMPTLWPDLFEMADVNGDGLLSIEDLGHYIDPPQPPIETVSFCSYWPFALGNRWDYEASNGAEITMQITNRLVVHGYDVWEFNLVNSYIQTLLPVYTYAVYADGFLHFLGSPADLEDLPYLPDNHVMWPAEIPIGQPFHLPLFGEVVAHRGSLLELLGEFAMIYVDGEATLYDIDAIGIVGEDGLVQIYGYERGPVYLSAILSPYSTLLMGETINGNEGCLSGPPPPQGIRAILRMADTNDDGVVTLEEFVLVVNMPGEAAEAYFHELDHNRDGVLSLDDMPEPPPAPEQLLGRLLRHADADGNGAVTLEEARLFDPDFPEELFAELDRNSDGVLTEADLPGVSPWPQPPVNAEPAELLLWALRNLDVDEDGIVTFEQVTAAVPGLPLEVIEMMDANGDGVLSARDVPDPAAEEERFLLFLELADLNADGEVSFEEYLASFPMAAIPEHPERAFAQLDRNGDGVLSPADLESRPPEDPDARLRWIIRQTDANGDGAATFDEVTASLPEFSAEAFARLDRNGDGVLSAQDLSSSPPPGPREQLLRLLREADFDNDGIVTTRELGVLVPELTMGAFNRLDRNGDGVLSEADLPPAHVDPAQRLMRLLREADADHDGVVTYAELQGFMPGVSEEQFAGLDTNGDGILSRDDAPVYSSDPNAYLRQLLAEGDANADRRVTFEELQAVAAGLTEEEFRALDRNGDGAITPEDLPESIPDPRDRFRALLRTVDADADGAVTLEEFLAAVPDASAERFDVLDRNADGVLTLEDLPDRPVPVEHAERARMLRLLVHGDTSRDGLLSFEEMSEVFPDAPAELLGELDLNGDWLLSRAEVMAALSRAETGELLIDAADVNADGRISALDLQIVINHVLGHRGSILPADIDGNGALDAVDVQHAVNGVLER
ncbi:MAG TPA: hypothetical protein ENN80_00455, partial [Candidatus Hydrogenedentes bacterium]|nr:hypothetical protein [Candidatus Hydrogenedentota bacterium]